MTHNRTPLLVIDDEQQIRRFLKVALDAHGFDVMEAVTGQEGLTMAISSRPELIILDLGLADMPGLTVLKKLREWYERPIIILSARDDEESIVTALDNGADDYVAKPFSIGELLARMRLANRKVPAAAKPKLVVGSLVVDLAERQISKDGQDVRLTSTEYSVLAFLVQNAGKVVTHAQILKAIWGPNSRDHVQYLRVYIGHLRQKIETNPAQPELILTEPGVGYRLKACHNS